jgi:methionyl-tRNA formyltransferase
VEAALLQGDPRTGLTLQMMEETMDAGPILAQMPIPLTDRMDARDLYREIRALAPEFLADSLEQFAAGELTPRKQVEKEATYCGKIQKRDGWLDWTESSRSLFNRVRALAWWPVAYTTMDGMLLRVHRAVMCSDLEEGPGAHEIPGTVLRVHRREGVVVRTGEGCLVLTELQPENRRRMSVQEFMNGYRDIQGKVLGVQKR